MTAVALNEIVPAVEPTWRQQERSEARAWFAANGLPTRRDEAWKYTPLDRLGEHDADRPAPRPDAWPEPGTIDELAGDHGATRLVFVNGHFDPGTSRIERSSRDLVCRPWSWLVAGRFCGFASVERAMRDQALARTPSRFDGYQALNLLHGVDGAVVWAGPQSRSREPVHIVHVLLPGATPAISHPRTFVRAESGSQLDVVESYIAGVDDGPCVGLVDAATTISMASGSVVRYHRVQAEGAGACHVGHTSVVQARDANLRARMVQLGSDVGRSALDVVLAGDGANADIAGLYLPSGTQHHDNVVTVEHAASHTTSRELFKGVVDDAARGCFTGHVLVQPGTAAVDAAQANRSLLLSRTAQSDTRPWLEILADDVRCTHGAAVGRLDDDSLFYLRARGIPEAGARAMLVGAFAGEVLDAVEIPTLRDHLFGAVGLADHRSDELAGARR